LASDREHLQYDAPGAPVRLHDRSSGAQSPGGAMRGNVRALSPGVLIPTAALIPLVVSLWDPFGGSGREAEVRH